MKKLILFAAIAAMIGVVSCNSKKKAEAEAEKARIEATRIADSIANAEALAAAEAEKEALAEALAAAEAEKEALAAAAKTKAPVAKAPAAPAPKQPEVKAPDPAPKEEVKTPSSPAERNAAIAKEKEEAVKEFRNK